MGPRAPLEREEVVQRLAQLIRSTLRGAILAPLLAYGHGTDSVQAQLIRSGRSISLELIADYGSNPLLQDRAAALQALPTVLNIVSSQHSRHLSALAPLHTADRSSYHPSSPLPLDSQQDTEHQLLGARWQWQADAEQLHFQVPEGSIHNVLLWELVEQQPPRWIMLLGGERSITLTLPAQPLPLPALLLGLVLASSCFFLLRSSRAA